VFDMYGLSFIDLFAGMGGFRRGMELAGHRCVGSCEIDKYARKAYAAYFNTEGEWFCDDVCAVDPGTMPDFDCLTFGWPCQDNSIAGKRAGQKCGTRSGLLFEATGILRAKKPRYFIAENVPGLFSVNGGCDFYATIREFADSGYDVQWQVFNTIWFLPQNRERIIFVGHLRGTPRPEVFPFGEDDGKDIVPGEAANCIDANYYKGPDNHGQRTLILQNKQQSGEVRVYHDKVPTMTKYWGTGGNNVPMIIDHQGRYSREHKLRANCPTLKAQHKNNLPIVIDMKAMYPNSTRRGAVKEGVVGALDQNCNQVVVQRSQSGTRVREEYGALRAEASTTDMSVWDGVRLRRLTPLECFRLQGFSDDYYYKCREIGISDTQMYKMAGNAMNVLVAREVGRRLAG
jgi:DNA (cytosine-5)-methyltransferase 1